MAERVCIGIPVRAEPGELLETLRLVRLHTDPRVAVVLLPDSPDGPVAEALRSEHELANCSQWGSSLAPQGAAACLNRLAADCDADVMVLLESGARVGPCWLEYLLAALRRPGCGLAGPSTNRSANEQAVFPDALGTRAGIHRSASEAIRRYGWAARSLEPLYSLAGFCYAVRREVFDTTGGADERYGLAPCWDMDLNIRAARAGFSGLWAGGAYVYRSPYTARRSAEYEHLQDVGKRRYQDRFCGLRLNGGRDEYKAHCDGDACEHFAPRQWLPGPAQRTLLPVAAVPGSAQSASAQRLSTHTASKSGRELRQEGPAAPPVAERPTMAPATGARTRLPLVRTGTGISTGLPRARPLDDTPLVSCIMPTHDRRWFVPLAINYFLRQDYPSAELVIVDDGTDPVGDLVPDHPAIHYHRLEQRMVLGAKRNLACDRANGQIIVHWDDDDWSSPSRLKLQVTRLLGTGAELCGMRSLRFYYPARRCAWRYRWPEGRRPWAAGTSFCYLKRLWARSPYAEVPAGEDTRFVWRAAVGPIADVSETDCVIALIHDRNTIQKSGRGAYWSCDSVAEIEYRLGADMAHYRSASPTEPFAAARGVECCDGESTEPGRSVWAAQPRGSAGN